MSGATLAVVLAGLTLGPPVLGAPEETVGQELQLKAWLATAGPYGEMWAADLAGH